LNKYFITLLLGLPGLPLTAQSVSTLIGAKANGIGYASATVFDTWGMFNNVAGIATLEKTSTCFTYDLHPSLSGANRTAAAIAVPLKIGVVGAGAYRFGDDLYNEHVISAGYSNQFGLAALGAKVNYIQYQTEGFGNKGVVTLSFGGIAKITPTLAIGAYITNINQPTISDEEKVPTRLNAGLSYSPTDKFFLATEIEKDLDYDAIWKLGMQYKFHEKFFARTGYNLHPNTVYFGLGFITKKFTLDYALQHNVSLSLSHQASISYQFTK
jgi:hypothetical protein